MPRATAPLQAALAALATACLGGPPAVLGDYDPLPWVDPFIGTGGEGFGQGSLFPGAAAPFGMVALSPDTRSKSSHVESFHNGGYWHEDSLLTGFSHLHLAGAGVPDLGALLFHPAPWMVPELCEATTRTVGFSHADERASPGTYAVTLANGIQAEVTAGQRVGIQRYAFPEGANPTVIVDLAHGLGSEGEREPASLRLYPEFGAMGGTMHVSGALSSRFGGFELHFWAEASERPTSWGVWGDGERFRGSDQVEAKDAGAWFSFSDLEQGEPLEMRVGVSFTSVEAARANLEAEPGAEDFDTLRATTEQAWRDALGRVRVHGGTESERTIFHTALYHALLMPHLMSDADGAYMGFDGQIHVDPDDPFYSDMSLWDTYRTLHPLLILAWPDAQQHFASSLVRMAEQGAYLPRWPLNSGYGKAMIGDPADIVLAETWLKGLADWDVSRGLRAAMLGADGNTLVDSDYDGRDGIRSYLEHGWVTTTATDGSVSMTMEYGQADHALALWTESWGLSDDAERYAERAHNPVNLFDAETGFFRGRDGEGTFAPAEDFSELAWNEAYVEGNAWQYLWAMPYDIATLADLLGGEEATLDRLDEFFSLSTEEEDSSLPEVYYWHGNEPDLHAPYLYALLDRPDLGAPWIQWIRDTRYGTGPDGLDGNDDGGTLSAWYALSALGLYPVAGTTTWALGPPLFELVEMDLHDGSTLIIEAAGEVSPSKASWQGVELDGSPIDGGTIEHADLLGGASLRFLLGPDEGGVESDWEKRP